MLLKPQLPGSLLPELMLKDDAYQFDDSVQAAIRLHQGACIKLSQTTPTVSDWALTVYVLAVGKETPSENALTVVNRINREIVVAMNLAVFPHLVQEVEENDALPVEIAAQAVPISGVQTEWTVMFRRSVTDPGA